jgi:hypothetical protein
MGMIGTTVLYEPQLSFEGKSYSFLNLWYRMELGDMRNASAALLAVDLEDLDNSPQYSLHRRPCKPVNIYKCGSERKISAPPRIEPLTSGIPSRSLVTLT